MPCLAKIPRVQQEERHLFFRGSVFQVEPEVLYFTPKTKDGGSFPTVHVGQEGSMANTQHTHVSACTPVLGLDRIMKLIFETLLIEWLCTEQED